jgi:hypothetical protein
LVLLGLILLLLLLILLLLLLFQQFIQLLQLEVVRKLLQTFSHLLLRDRGVIGQIRLRAGMKKIIGGLGTSPVRRKRAQANAD